MPRRPRRLEAIACALCRSGTSGAIEVQTPPFVGSYDHLPVPRPSTDLKALTDDVDTFGYCIIAEALAKDEVSALVRRASQQATAELNAGVAEVSQAAGPGSSRQGVASLLNKGHEFVQLLDHPVATPVLQHIVGKEMQLSVHNAIIIKPGGPAMPLHSDQWWMPQPQRKAVPPRIRVGSVDRVLAHTADWAAESDDFIAPAVAAQAVWMASDFGRANGATMVTPGSVRSYYASLYWCLRPTLCVLGLRTTPLLCRCSTWRGGCPRVRRQPITA